MLPDRVPLEIYAQCAGALGWDPALVRAFSLQESAENPNWIRFESHKWKLYRMASREAKAFDGMKNAKTPEERWARFFEMDAVCERDAQINPAARDAAMLSHSIGFSQPMGFNHKFCGFNSVMAFWRAQRTIEGQAATFAAMVKSSPRLLELGKRLDLRPRKWGNNGKTFRLGDLSEISAIWNGPAFEKNDHDRGLQKHIAFARKEASRGLV